MTSMPASRRARAITLAPRSWPSRPGLATRTRIFGSAIASYLTTNLKYVGARGESSTRIPEHRRRGSSSVGPAEFATSELAMGSARPTNGHVQSFVLRGTNLRYSDPLNHTAGSRPPLLTSQRFQSRFVSQHLSAGNEHRKASLISAHLECNSWHSLDRRGRRLCHTAMPAIQ